MESWLFLGIILLVAILAKNRSLTLTTAFVLIMKFTPTSCPSFPRLQDKGINIGVTIITAAILIPIATGEIDLRDLLEASKPPIGWVAVFCGGLMTVLSSKDAGLIVSDPRIIVALVFGTTLGVVFLRGTIAGSVIASGITYCTLQIFALGK